MKSPVASLLFALPERATAFICCVMSSMVNDKRAILPLGMLAAGSGMQQKVIPSAVRFCQHDSGPIRNYHSTFDYDHSIFSYSPEEDSIKYSTIMSAIAPKIIINAAKRAWLIFLKQEMILSTGNGSQLLVHCLKFAASFGTKPIHSK